MSLLFILIFLYQIGCDKTENGILTEERYLCQLQKSCSWNEGNVRILESLKSRLERNLKFIPKVDLIKWSTISFHSWNLSSYNHLIHEHWRLGIFEFMSTFLRPPSSKELNRVSCLILGAKLFQINVFIFIFIFLHFFNELFWKWGY